MAINLWSANDPTISIHQHSLRLRLRFKLSVPHGVLSSQFFADVKEAQDKMKKMQENMKKKYSCDRSTTATRLEDLLQDAVVRADCLH